MKDDTISRAVAIDAFMKATADGDKAGFCVDIIKELPTAQMWIPCSEMMPDEDYWTGAGLQYSADVLMTVYNAEDEETIIDFGHTVDGSWYSDTTDCLVPSGWEVLAWMPLPKPWERGQDDG